MSQLQRSFEIPGYHDVALFIARLKGVKFGNTVSDGCHKKVLQKYGQMQRNRNIQGWLLGLQKSEVNNAQELHLVFTLPTGL